MLNQPKGTVHTANPGIAPPSLKIDASAMHNSNKTSSSNGFSLIEVLITCALISILSMICLPNLRHLLQRGQQLEVQLQLQTIRLHLLDTGTSPSIHNPYYNIQIQPQQHDTRITATRNKATSAHKCNQLSIWQLQSQPDTPTSCWQK